MPHHGTSRQHTASPTNAFPPDDWRALVRLPGQVIVAASAVAPDPPVVRLPRRRSAAERDGVAEALAGMEAVAAGRSCASPLVRDVVSAIYLEDGDGGYHAPRDVLGACALAGAVLAARAWPADAEAYRHWIEAVAGRVCHAVNADSVFETGGPALTPAQWRFLAELRAAFVRAALAR